MARKANEIQLTNLTDFYKKFPNEVSCHDYLRDERFPDGKVPCTKCGTTEKIYRLKDGKRYKCGHCKHIFTITVGTVFEASHVQLQKWFLALYIVSAHKKGISSLQLHRDLGITQKTAWFMLHRIRFILANGTMQSQLSGTVEVDETYIGGKNHRGKTGRGSENKTAVVGLLQRGGEVTSFPVEKVNRETLHEAVLVNVKTGSNLMTDEFGSYNGLGRTYKHRKVNHGIKEYARGDVHVNSLEGFWSLLKRGIVGIYHVVSTEHLHRYCEEFNYRYTTRKMHDAVRFQHTFSKCGGRLTYKELIG